jgi:Fe-S-cluster containining protein
LYDGDVPWCLSFHANYGCRHSGACCTTGWPIPFDPTEAARVDALQLVGIGGFVRPGGRSGRAYAATASDGTCSFFEPDNRLCAIHRAGGQALLPVTCQMFPRLVLTDPRGAFVSLSHYCPTAAGLLFDAPRPASIVEAPASLVSPETLEGLDATNTWAPLLKPGVLMDLESFGEWERRAIQTITGDDITPWGALGQVESATASLLEWRPDSGGGPLPDVVRRSFDSLSVEMLDRVPDGSMAKFVRQAVPQSLLPQEAGFDGEGRLHVARDAMEQHAGAICRWLAARLFGTWIAYQGTGLRTILRYLRAALDVLTLELAHGAGEAPLDRQAIVEAVRRSDYLIIHLAGSQRLATLLS